MKHAHQNNNHRGGALLVAMVMALLLMAIAGASLSLVSTNRGITDKHFSYHALMPVGERGIDQAMKVLNVYLKNNNTFAGDASLLTEDTSKSWDADGWKAFTNSDPNLPSDTKYPTYSYAKEFNNIALGDGRTCTLKIKALNIPRKGYIPPFKTYAVAEVSAPGLTYNRQFIASFSSSSSSAPGMVSMQLITFTGGNVYIAAYDSRFGIPNDTYIDPADGKKKTNLFSDVTVATFYAKDLDLGKVNIYGFVSTIPGTDAYFATNGAHIWDVNSNSAYQTAGVDGYDNKGNLITGDPTITPNILDNFTLNPDDFKPKTNADITAAIAANYPTATVPAQTDSNTIVANSKGELFLKSDLKNPINKLAGDASNGGVYYMGSDIGLKTGSSLTIAGHITLLGNAPSVQYTFDASGQGNLLISDKNSSFSIYSNGSVSVGGNSVMGTMDTTAPTISPKQFLISSTYDPKMGGTTPTITFNGNGALAGMIYAPNADLYMKGGGSTGTIRGSIVAHTVNANGVTNFYFDKNLSSTVTPQFRLNAIAELTGKNKASF